jgi:hypothetical protein
LLLTVGLRHSQQASSGQRFFSGGALGPDVSAHLPNRREWRAYRAGLISTIDHAAVEFGRRSKGRATARDNSRELFQLVFGPCSITHDINSSPSAFSARAIAVLARRNLLFALRQIIPTPVFWFRSGS